MLLWTEDDCGHQRTSVVLGKSSTAEGPILCCIGTREFPRLLRGYVTVMMEGRLNHIFTISGILKTNVSYLFILDFSHLLLQIVQCGRKVETSIV